MEEIEQRIIQEIRYQKDRYIDASEDGHEGIKNAIGKKLNKLNKCLEILNS